MTSHHDMLIAMLPHVAGQPEAMLALARQFAAISDLDRAGQLSREAMAISPDSEAVRVNAASVLSNSVPRWHFAIVADLVRNQAYETALRAAIKPGDLVLEIGTGSGLLAMMAARAGAQVVTCEADAVVAAAARAVIAANGLSKQVRVINSHSSGVTLADLGRPADIVVSEIISNDLLGEGAVAAHADVIGRLTGPEPVVIPAKGRIRIAPAFDTMLESRRMGVVSGFDLSPFNMLAAPYHTVPVNAQRLRLCGAGADLFAFDFACAAAIKPATGAVELLARPGPVNGIVQWIQLDLDTETSYENQPGSGVSSCWGALFWPFREMVESDGVRPISIRARHFCDRALIWQE